MHEKVAVSVVVPIKNEAANLPACLGALAWAAEIFVVDSHSQDESRAIAERHGARVIDFAWNGQWPKKKNWALQTLPFAHEWVLFVDADEVVDAALADELRAIVNAPTAPDAPAGYWINRRFMFMGRWLKHAYYPNWNLRFFRHARGHFEKLVDGDTGSGDVEIHEHVVVDGPTARLRAEMDHYAFPSVAAFVEKHNRYSNWEAALAFAEKTGVVPQDAAVALRRRLKKLSRLMPARPLLRFLYVYLWQRGFLDGAEGYYFARMHAMYELLTVVKTAELMKTKRER